MGKFFSSSDLIRLSVGEGIARITLNRPEKRNALSPQMLDDMFDAFIEADALNDVNVIVLEGAGKDFCAGYDLAGTYDRRAKEQAGGPDDAAHYRTSIGTFDDDCWGLEQTQRKTLVMAEVHKPVIAKVQGNCLAGGTDMALMCDMVVVAEDARIGFPATRANGTPPNHMWVYHMGPQWAKRMLMTGDSLTGRDACRLGLVLEAYPADRLDAEVIALARRIANVDAELLSTHKRVVNVAMELMGARTLQRMSAEIDARAHLSKGPRRTRFKADMAASGLKEALRNRDAPFGDGLVRLGEHH
ncbi:MAG: crotonase/enoyl-CoA hydratase family protein [Gammaproteobacteria bacterium]